MNEEFKAKHCARNLVLTEGTRGGATGRNARVMVRGGQQRLLTPQPPGNWFKYGEVGHWTTSQLEAEHCSPSPESWATEGGGMCLYVASFRVS